MDKLSWLGNAGIGLTLKKHLVLDGCQVLHLLQIPLLVCLFLLEPFFLIPFYPTWLIEFHENNSFVPSYNDFDLTSIQSQNKGLILKISISIPALTSRQTSTPCVLAMQILQSYNPHHNIRFIHLWWETGITMCLMFKNIKQSLKCLGSQLIG
jgi:hypothetical protein